MTKLNEEQKKAIEYVKDPLLIVAGAGTGKTTVITQKITRLVEKKLALPEEILALTFTDKAAEEMLERVDKTLEISYSDIQISTFHSFCQRILENHGLDVGISNQFKLLTQTDAWLLVKQNLDKFNLDYYRPLGNPIKHIHELIKHFSKCKDELISPSDYLNYAENVKLDSDNAEIDEKNRLTEIANAFHVYNQLLLDKGLLDFGDLIYYTIKLLQTRPKILKNLQERFKFILVDEFQDVNYAQYELVRLLCGEKNQLTVVGDDDQSIYAFRGASVSNILRFKEDYPKAQEIVLTKNYRSGQEILNLAYASIQNNNPDRLEVKLNIKKKLKSEILNLKSSVEHLHYQTLDEEVQGVIKKIKEIQGKEKASWNDFAILVRANNHAEPFISGLENNSIPFEFLASTGLYRQPIVLDCVNFLRVINNYHESSAVYRLLSLPFLGLKENDLQKLIYNRDKKTISFYESLKRATEFGLSKEGIELADKIVTIIHEGMKLTRMEKPGAIILNFLENIGYLKYFTIEEDQGNSLIIHQIHQLRQFFNYLKKYEDITPGANVAGFLEHFESVLESGDEGDLYQPSDTPDSVNVITIHKAKGLEFKYVFVVNMVEDRFPSRRRGEAIELPVELIKEKLPEGDFHIQEERRLFYVATTRAKEKLFFTSADYYSEKRAKKLSRFLDELEFKTEKNNKEIPELKFQSLSSKKGIKEDRTDYILPKTLSYSKINSFQRCPYQFKLAYVLEIPTKGGPSLSFGQTIHNTLHKFYTQIKVLNSAEQGSLFNLKSEILNLKSDTVKVPTVDELIKMYESSWVDDWYKSKTQKEQYYKKGKEILKSFYKLEENNWTVPIVLEGFFKIKIGDYFLTGRIDRIDKKADETLEIIDYKTGQAKEKIVGDDKNQLLIYQLAAQTLSEYKNFGLVGNLTYYYLEENTKQSFLGKTEELVEIKDKILEIIEKMKVGNFIPTPSEHICSHCDFKDICEFRKL